MTVREPFLDIDRLDAICLDRCLYSQLSLRAGGTSTAANAGVPDMYIIAMELCLMFYSCVV